MMTHFQVKNYKCLAEISLPLTPLHVIIGQNDSGKTSLLEAIFALYQSMRTHLPNAFPDQWDGTELVFEGAKEPCVEFHAEFQSRLSEKLLSVAYHLTVEFPETGKLCRRADEWFDDGTAHILTEPASHPNTTGLFTRHNPHLSSPERRKLSELASTIGDARFYRLDPKTMAVPAALDPNRKFRLDPDGFGLPTLIDDILGAAPNQFLSISEKFCGYFPHFKRLWVETEAALTRIYNETGIHNSTQGTGKGIFFETIHGQKIRAQQASDGAILFLGLLALMNTPMPPKLLLIEEPEKGVYPKRLTEVIEMLRSLEAKSTDQQVPQLILTTHSPYLLSAFKPDEVTILSREGGTGPVRARPLRYAPHIHERLNDGEFYLGELWYNLSEDELFGDA